MRKALAVLALLLLLLSFGCIKQSKSANLGCCDIPINGTECTYNLSPSGPVKFSDSAVEIEEAFPGLLGSTGTCSNGECRFSLPSGEEVRVPVCNATEDYAGVGCTALVCSKEGFSGGSSSIYSPADFIQAEYIGLNLTEASQGEDFEQTLPAPVLGLLHAKCQPIYLDTAETKRKIKENTLLSLRIGMGRSFQDYELAKEYFPPSDVVCSINPAGKVERYTNYYFRFLDDSTSTARLCRYSPARRAFYFEEDGKTVFFSSFVECLREASTVYSHSPPSVRMYDPLMVCEGDVGFPFAKSPGGTELPTADLLYPLFYAGSEITYAGDSSDAFTFDSTNSVYSDISSEGVQRQHVPLMKVNLELQEKWGFKKEVNATFQRFKSPKARLSIILPKLYIGPGKYYEEKDGGDFLYLEATNYSDSGDPFALPFECSNNGQCLSGFCNTQDYQRTVLLANVSGENVSILDSWCFSLNGILSCTADFGKKVVSIYDVGTGYALQPTVFAKAREKGDTSASVIAPRAWVMRNISALVKGKYVQLPSGKIAYVAFGLPKDDVLYNNAYIDWKGYKADDGEKFNRGINVHASAQTMWYCTPDERVCRYVVVHDRDDLCNNGGSPFTVIDTAIWNRLKDALLSGRPALTRVCGAEYVACANPIFWNTTDDFEVKINNYCTGHDYDPLRPEDQGGTESGVLEYQGMSYEEAKAVCTS